MKQLFIAKAAADAFREQAQKSSVEHGGALLVTPDDGDIVAYVPGPDTLERTEVSVRVFGRSLDEAVRHAMVEHPGAVFGGYAHLHVNGPPSLSSGDYAQLAALHANARSSFPSCGIVALLGVKAKKRVTLQVWISRSGVVVEQMELVEVDDPMVSRRRSRSMAAHALATDAGRDRFARELEGLGEAGHLVTAEPSLNGVTLRVTHPDREGVLRFTIPAEGWHRPPKVEVESESGTNVVTGPLHTFLPAWSSAFTLVDLVEYLTRRGIWPRREEQNSIEVGRSQPVTRYLLLDVVARELEEHRPGVVYGTANEGAAGRVIMMAATVPAPGLVPVASTSVHDRLPFLDQSSAGWHVVEPAGTVAPVTVLPWSVDYAARHAGIVDPTTLGTKRVLVVGLGSVGLPMAMHFVKAGIASVTLVDGETVAIENIIRVAYEPHQIGEPKVMAATELLVRANPRVRVRPVTMTLHDALVAEPDLLDGVDLIVNAASSATGFELAAAAHRKVPILFPGCHAKAASGEIFISGGTSESARPCFACYRSRTRPTPTPTRSWAYDAPGAELAAEPGLGADIGHVVAIASSIGINLLAGASERVTSFERPLLLVTNRAGALHEASYTTQWVAVARDPECPNHTEPERDGTIDADTLVAALDEAAA